MWRESARRLVVIVLSVALATALVARSVQAGSMEIAAAATTAMEPMAMDMPMHGMCDGCAGHEKSTASVACSAYCGATIASPYLVLTYSPIAAEAMAPRIALAATGLAMPPDPYPPRPASMS